MYIMPEWPCARGLPPEATAIIRQSPEDFFVDEHMEIDFSGAGEHLWLHIEKTGLTTHNAGQSLGRALNCAQRDIGYSGLKDRQAVTRQWFSLSLGVHANLDEVVANAGDIDGIRVLDAQPHHRKLKRGTHQSNRFVLTLRDVKGQQSVIDDDLARVARDGVPNYFGEQRFSGGRNIEMAEQLFAGRRLKRNQRSIVISAARSLLFNKVLGRRVSDETWNRLLPGERAILDGTGSHFAVSAEDLAGDELTDRLSRFDIHPSGPLPGRGRSDVEADVLALEHEVLAGDSGWIEGLERLGVNASRRPLRLVPQALQWDWIEPTVLKLEFALPPGSYATTLLREIVQTVAP